MKTEAGEAGGVMEAAGEGAPEATGRGGRRSLWLGLLATALTLLSPGLYVALIDNRLVHQTAWPTLLVMAIACGLAWYAFDMRRRLRSGIFVGLNLGLTLMFVFAFFGLTRLPAADAAASGGQAPGFTLPDEQGRPVALSEALAGGPVLLVFYRGHW